MKLSKYQSDLKALIELGTKLDSALVLKTHGISAFDDTFREAVLEDDPEVSEKDLEDKINKQRKVLRNYLPSFSGAYQGCYSESLSLINTVAPDRYDDFISQYKKPRAKRKEITFENYVIEDAIQGLKVTRGGYETVVSAKAALPRFRIQLAIVQGLENRFVSSLYDIESLVQADLLDSELEAARLLHKNKFIRAAGAICGVVIEAHLSKVSSNRDIKFKKKNLTIADFNDALKSGGVYGIPQWRKVQYLADIRNKCDHKKEEDPSSDEVLDLINGTDHLVKNIF